VSGPDAFSARIAGIIKRIPRGRVATYGQVAAMAGNPRASRLVVWTLRALSEREGLPWHRVINSKGTISLAGDGGRIQRGLLEQEGVRFDAAGRVALDLFQWRG